MSIVSSGISAFVCRLRRNEMAGQVSANTQPCRICTARACEWLLCLRQFQWLIYSAPLQEYLR